MAQTSAFPSDISIGNKYIGEESISKPKVARGADPDDRFDSKVDDGPPTDCWPWTDRLDKQGRGVFWLDGRAVNPDEAATLAARLEAWATR